MPTSRGEKGKEQVIKNRSGGRAQLEKASSFHGRTAMSPAASKQLRRPWTVPELAATGKGIFVEEQRKPRLTKLLLNVTLHGSVGSLQVVVSPESTVHDLVAAAVKEYVKEGRRPFLCSVDPFRYDLHYSQFSLESLNREEKLMELGSRNFFICPRKSSITTSLDENDDGVASLASTCSRQVKLVDAGSCFEWLKLINFLTLINCNQL